MNLHDQVGRDRAGAPSRLWTGALVAWLRLGSLTDQVSSARVRLRHAGERDEAGDFGRPAPWKLAHRRRHVVDNRECRRTHRSLAGPKRRDSRRAPADA